MDGAAKATAERYAQSAWDLTELLPEPSEAVVAERLERLEEGVRALESARPLLRAEIAPADFVGLLRASERLMEQMALLGAYGSLWFAADTQSTAALAYRNRIQQALTGFENRLLFLSLWWKGLGEEEAQRLLQAVAADPDYLHYLRDLRRLRPYMLPESSEQIINLKDSDGIGAVLTVYAMVTNRFEFRFTAAGEERLLTRDALMSYAYSPRPEERAACYRELCRVYGEQAPLLGQLYGHRVRDWHNENVLLRGFSSALAVRNVANDIPDEAAAVLLRVARAEAPLFQRYFRLKARWLGAGRLRRYDLYAPLAGSQRTVPFADAVALVLDTFRGFDRRLAELAERVLAEGHLDSEVRKGKKGGAFCATVLPRLTPWVLANYNRRVRDVTTLAHELGHAVHSMLAAHHSLLTQHPSLPLAETASVFAEMLVTDRLLREERDPLARRELLAAVIADIYATVIRQTFFVLFEVEAHDAVLAGRSTEEISDLYFALLREQFGDGVELAPEFRHEWLSIPHIYQSPFYCYAYSFGQLLVMALYQRFREQGEAFKSGYLRLLAHGGGAPPLAILAEAGVDPTDPDFWRGGFAVIRGLIDELELSEK